jgi:hypothetical protein
VEGRSSFAQSDQRFAISQPGRRPALRTEGDGPNPNRDFTRLLTSETQRVSAHGQSGRRTQLRDERCRPFGWNNIGRVFDAAKLRLQYDAFALTSNRAGLWSRRQPIQ